MMQDSFFDPTPYGRIPPLSLPAAVVLARALVSNALDNLSGLPQRALMRMSKAADEADAALVARRQALGAASASGIEIDTRADRIIAGLRMRLDAYALLPDDEHPLATRAAELSEQLFPEGLGFLKQPYVEQLSAMQTLIKHIDDDQLSTELDAICGTEFLHSLRTVLPRYRGMVEALLSQQDNSASLQEHRRRLTWSISDYATKIAALQDEDDPASIERVRAALRPIDAIREQQTHRSGAEGAQTKDSDSEPAHS